MRIFLFNRPKVAALVAAAAFMALALPATSAATFAGSNGKIFYEGVATGNDIFSVDPLGGAADNLTESSEPNEQRPAASADGRVAFQAFGEGGWNIFKMNADGSGIVNLTKTLHPDVINFEPTWSPDGSEVVYMRSDASGQDLWRIGADGSNPENLTETAGVQETSAEFSPDGTRIAYVSSGPKLTGDPETNNDIWVMDADGSNQTQLTKTNLPRQNLSPTWSPDGTKIAFSTTASEGGGADGFWVMDSDGTDQTRPLPGGLPISSLNLSWSPDGTKIAYQPMAGGLWVMNPDGTGAAPLAGNTGNAYPSWAPAEGGGGGGGGAGSGGGSAPATSPSPGPTTALPPPPSNKIAIVKVKLNKAKGTATLTVRVPGPGTVVLSGKGVKKASKAVAAAGTTTLPVKATAKALKKLNEKDAVALKVSVAFTPRGGSLGAALRSVTLKKLP